ncbi:MAG: lytic transglycosylase domain-containing protein [Acidobacteria bacterium]|nr:lytic transglycosylase domain-containing protein [Acidobacteriota bacterium]
MNVSRFNVPRLPRLRSFKFTPVALIAFFLLYNLIGFVFSSAFAPAVQAGPTAPAKPFIPANMPTSGDAELDQVILRAGEEYGVDPRLLHAVIWQESKYNQNARSHAGAQGLMQLIPATAERFDCQNMSDPRQNVAAGTKYLRFLLQRFNGNVVLALAGYNAGEGSVDKYNGVPPYSETQNYVRIITSRYGKTYHPLLAPEQARVQFGLVPQTEQVAQLAE